MILKLAVLALLLSASIHAGDCEEQFELDSLSHAVPARWCGQLLDSNEIADTNTLTRLPGHLCWKDYRIYMARVARDALVVMAEAAAKDGAPLLVKSGYRSPRYQRIIIKRRLARGQEMSEVLAYVAPPGYSEHETGRAVDLGSLDGHFVFSEAYTWLKHHAAEYGFVESIPEDSTGQIAWEPWHWLYRPDSTR